MSKLIERYNKSPFANIGAKVTSLKEKAVQNINPIDTTNLMDTSFEDIIIKPYKTLLDSHAILGDIIVNPKTATISQKCHNYTYCFDPKAQQHRSYKLGFIKDDEIVEKLRDWCIVNKWDFVGPPTYIDSEWIGDSESESE